MGRRFSSRGAGQRCTPDHLVLSYQGGADHELILTDTQRHTDGRVRGHAHHHAQGSKGYNDQDTGGNGHECVWENHVDGRDVLHDEELCCGYWLATAGGEDGGEDEGGQGDG